MKPSRTLVGMITDRATKSFTLPLDAAHFKEWEEHWINTGWEVHAEFVQEGLPKTAEAIHDIVTDTIKWRAS